MREERIDKKRLFIFIGVALSVIIVIALSKYWRLKDDIPNFGGSYKVFVKIEAVKDDDSKESHTLEAVNLKNGSKVTGDFYQRSIYIDDGRTIFDDGGKYKYYDSKNSIRYLDDIIGKVDLGNVVEIDGDRANYNPLVSKDVINSLLDVLFIDRESSRDEHAFVVLKDKKVESFSLYLVGVDGYKDINISMTFGEIDKQDYFEMPVFYEEVMDKIDDDEIMIIK